MAGNQAGRRPAPQPVHGNWWSDAGNALEQKRREFEARGRQIYEAALREGRPILARTEAELRELGAKAQQAEAKYIRQNVAAAKGVAAVVKNPRSAEAQRFIRDTQNQAVAYAHGAGDGFTMGLADPVSSAIRATVQSAGDLSQWGTNYHADMEQEGAQDAYEAANYGDARFGGQVAGTVGSLLVPGLGVGKVAKLANAPVVRLVAKAGGGYARTTPMIASERAAITAAGGLNGVASQAISDAATGHRSTLGDYAVAGTVGALQARMAPRFGAGISGAIGGAATSVGQDLIDGRPIDPLSATVSAGAGGATGYAADSVGSAWAKSLPRKATLEREQQTLLPASEEALGETMGRVRTLTRGQRTEIGPKKRYYLANGNYTYPDGRISASPFAPITELAEQKFERGRVSYRQQEAMDELQERYRLDGYLARDIGASLGLPAADTASDVARGYDSRLRKRMDIGWDW